MPRGDRTGPLGMGPMTGRGAGLCGGYSNPGYMNSPGGRLGGSGRCFTVFGGRGRGFRNWFYATGLPGWLRFGSESVTSKDDEMKFLKSHSEYLSGALEKVNAGLAELAAKDSQ